MIVFPKAKINLGLRITGRRNDGYHDIETLFYPVGLCDALEFVVISGMDKNDILTVTGIPVGISPEENIVLKAVKKLREKYPFPLLRIHLHKAIPHGAGLGGGSSDAACMLKSINRHFSLGVSEEELKSLSLGIGSDCPFFIDGDPAFATGRGEILVAAKPILTGTYLMLFNPGVGISTRDAYQNCRVGKPSVDLAELTSRSLSEWKDHVVNDFEEYAFTRYPVIRQIKDELYGAGALFSLMSGSGSSVYGIFSAKPTEVPSAIKEMLLWAGPL